ncbi:radical SAM family heme chaperone HemW [bacterium]|nr:radical SAM family heme chaperone HemW [candidate division CSSED10-310 bacterium]
MIRSAPAGLYLHVPFCKTICPYCDFHSITDTSHVHDWCDAVRFELARMRHRFPPFDTVFFGGGTPSAIDPASLSSVLASLLDQKLTECTIELNPDDVTIEQVSRYLEAGINRLSLGVQSLNDRELRFLGRRHDAAQAMQAMDICRDAGGANLSVDIMFGLPGQRLESCLATLREVLSRAPEHISCYQLTIAEGTPLHDMIDGGSVHELPEDDQCAMFLGISEYLRDHGYEHYEVSNYSLGDEYRCRHNLKYWRHQPYLGLGPAAHSFLGMDRWWNIADVQEYCSRLKRGGDAVDTRETLTAEQLRLERLALGFRTAEGVALADLTGSGTWQTSLERMTAHGLLVPREDRLIPTVEGYLLADRLALEFAC